jgi:putative ATPase
VAQDVSREVPLRLRNASTRLMKDLGYGQGYRYAHDEPGALAQGESYWPDDLREPPLFYEPADRGLEIRIGERLKELRQSRDSTGE